MESTALSLTAATWVYSGIAVGLLGLAVFWFRRRMSWGRFFGGLLALLGLTLLLALVMCMPESRPLRAARLLCIGWFVHIPVFLAACCVISDQKTIRFVACGMITTIAALAVFCFWIEPFRLEVTHYYIRSPKVSRELNLALMADFQTDEFEAYQEDTLRRLMQEQPDAIFLAGDYLQSQTQEGWEILRDGMNSFLHEIGFGAPLGCYAVGGNTDFRRWPEIFRGFEMNFFKDSDTVEMDEFVVTGFSVMDSFATDMHAPSTDKFHIALGHAPDFSLGPDVRADLMVAGHTHGGQVRLPGIGPIVTFSQVPRSWAAGLTKVDSQRTLVVSRGIGMERRDAPRLRFLCRPELAFIHVLPE